MTPLNFIAVFVALLVSAAIFTAGMKYCMDFEHDRVAEIAQAQVDSAIEDAQLWVSDAYAEAEKFQRSITCVATTRTAEGHWVCLKYEPRVRK